jgi:hypothetical protein
MMRLPSLSKSKSEVFGQSGHCSARLLAALRAKSGLTHCSTTPSLDHLVSALLELHRHVETERLGGLDVDHQFELNRGLYGKLTRFRALEDAIDIGRRAPKIIDQVISVGQQAADCSFRVSLDDFVGEQQE